MARCSDTVDNFVRIKGFTDWNHVHQEVSRHESSIKHQENLAALIQRKQSGGRVDAGLVQQIEEEQKYWEGVLQRVIEVTKFLAACVVKDFARLKSRKVGF
jgi:hypothetical protein